MMSLWTEAIIKTVSPSSDPKVGLRWGPFDLLKPWLNQHDILPSLFLKSSDSNFFFLNYYPSKNLAWCSQIAPYVSQMQAPRPTTDPQVYNMALLHSFYTSISLKLPKIIGSTRTNIYVVLGFPNNWTLYWNIRYKITTFGRNYFFQQIHFDYDKEPHYWQEQKKRKKKTCSKYKYTCTQHTKFTALP